MEALKIFENMEFGKVRTVKLDDKAYFAATDVAEMLGYKNPHKAIQDNCKWVEKRKVEVQTGVKADGSPAIRKSEMNFIPIGDVFRLSARSELPGADKFESWIFDEVVPAIFNKGYYALPKIEEAIQTLIEQTEMYHYEIAERIMGTHIGSYADWKANKQYEEEQRKKRMWQEQGYKYSLNMFSSKYEWDVDTVWKLLTPKEKTGHVVFVAGMNYFDEHLLLLIDKKLEKKLEKGGETTTRKERIPNWQWEYDPNDYKEEI